MSVSKPEGHRLPVGISSCLLGQAVRYDGGHKHAPIIEIFLGPAVEWIPVCPELDIGLGVPREPIRLEGHPAAPRLRAVASRKNLTGVMTGYAAGRIEALIAAGLCGYVLKKDSPSCGVSGVPVFDGGERVGSTAGLFAGLLAARCAGLPMIEEDRLDSESACLEFLERVRAYRSSRPADLNRGS